jgi:copper transport protein
MVSYLGILFFRFLILPNRLAVQKAVQIRFSRMLWAAWSGIAVSVMFSLPVQAKVDAGVNLGQALSPQLLETVLIHTEFGSVWMAQIGLVLALLLTTLLSGLWQRTFGLISGLLAIGLLVSKSLTGHEATTFHPAFTITLDVLHLFAASVWVGGLLGLVLLVPWSAPITVEAGDGQTQWHWEAIRRFSPWGIASVLILMLTGMYAAFQQIPTSFALFHTAYGKTLMVKICLFLMMLGLGVYHWFSRYLSERNPSRDIYPSIWIEFGLGALILIVTAVVANLPTPMSTPGPVFLTRSLGNGITATLHINPNVAGSNSFAVELKDKSGKPYTDVQQVTLTFSSLDTGIGSDTVRVPEAAPGVYKLKGIYLTSAGHWDVRVHLLTDVLQDMDANFRIVVGSPQGE